MPFIGLYRCPKAIETWDLRLAISASGDGDVERRQKMKQLLKKAAFLLESMTGWWFLYKQPIFGEDSRFDWYFSKGLVQPPTSMVLVTVGPVGGLG